jgi:hypothetical protein
MRGSDQGNVATWRGGGAPPAGEVEQGGHRVGGESKARVHMAGM